MQVLLWKVKYETSKNSRGGSFYTSHPFCSPISALKICVGEGSDSCARYYRHALFYFGHVDDFARLDS